MKAAILELINDGGHSTFIFIGSRPVSDHKSTQAAHICKTG